MTDDHTFRVPYWDWRDPLQRDVPFQRKRLGENIDGNVEGDLFDDDKWKIRCWEDIEDPDPPLPICNPVQPSSENLRRCPNATLCDKSNENWPSYVDVATAVGIDTYDTSPYDRFIEDTNNSYRNYMEGFIVKPGEDCGDNTMCTVDSMRGVTVSRKNHNTVHIILGIGDLRSGPNLPFDKTGVMAHVAASPNDPVFINHHGMIDCILEEWLLKNKNKPYPESDEIREGHRADDYIVPFISPQMQKDMFKTADNFGYSCSYIDDDDKSGSVSVHAYVSLMIGLLAAAVAHISIP
jgi:hypothetical protein